MCISNDSYRSPRVTISLKFQSFDLLPPPPCYERFTSGKTEKAIVDNLEQLCIPFHNDDDDDAEIIRLNFDSSILVQRTLHRMSNKRSRPVAFVAVAEPGPELQEEKEPPTAPAPETEEEDPSASSSSPEQNVIVERLSQLMQNNSAGGSNNQTQHHRRTNSKSSSESDVSSGGVRLIRNVKRTNSGAALCA